MKMIPQQWVIRLMTVLFLSFPVLATVPDARQPESVDALVRKTPLENPEVLTDQHNQLQQAVEAEATRLAQQKTLTTYHEALFENRNDPVQGSNNSQLTIVYFFDYNCSICKRQDEVMRNIMQAFPQVRVVYKDMPILTKSSLEAAKMTLAVYRQAPGQYADLHRRLLSKPGSHNSNSVQAAIRFEGFDPDFLKKTMRPDISQHIAQNIEIAHELGIKTVPALVFHDRVVDNSMDENALTNLIKNYL